MEIKNILDEPEASTAAVVSEPTTGDTVVSDASGKIDGSEPVVPPLHRHHWSTKLLLAATLLISAIGALVLGWYYLAGPGHDRLAASSPSPSASATAKATASASAKASASPSASASTQVSTSPSPSAPAGATKWFNLTELGVRFNNNSSDLTGLRYTYKLVGTGASALPVAYLGTTDLAAQSAACTDGSIGAVAKYKAGDQVFGEPVESSAAAKKVGNYYYTLEGPQSWCGGDEKTSTGQLQTKQKTALQNEALSTLELIPGGQQ